MNSESSTIRTSEEAVAGAFTYYKVLMLAAELLLSKSPLLTLACSIAWFFSIFFLFNNWLELFLCFLQSSSELWFYIYSCKLRFNWRLRSDTDFCTRFFSSNSWSTYEADSCIWKLNEPLILRESSASILLLTSSFGMVCIFMLNINTVP